MTKIEELKLKIRASREQDKQDFERMHKKLDEMGKQLEELRK